MADAHFKALLESPSASARLYGLAGEYFTDNTFLRRSIGPYLENSERVEFRFADDVDLLRVSDIAERIKSGDLPRSLRDDTCPLAIHQGFLGNYKSYTDSRDATRISLAIQDGQTYRRLFEEPVFTANSELGLRSVTPPGDPDFARFATVLTNDKKNTVWLDIDGGGIGQSESDLFDLDTNDFSGSNIVRIDMIVRALEFIPRDAGGTAISVSVEIRIWARSEDVSAN